VAEVHLLLSELSVCMLPPDHPEYDLFAVKVAWRGSDQYGVIWRSRRLSRSGKWSWEPLPSSRTDAWIKRHSFSYDEARERACKVAPTITCNGRTALQAAKGPDHVSD
jgi:hypothetical protein